MFNFATNTHDAFCVILNLNDRLLILGDPWFYILLKSSSVVNVTNIR